jgi:phosphoserine phosphatase
MTATARHPATAPLALFDFDGTIVDCDTFARFCGHLIFASPWRPAVVLGALVLGLLALPALLLAGWTFASFGVWVCTFALDEDHLDALMQRFAADFPRGLLMDQALVRLEACAAEGLVPVLVTGTPRLLVERLAARLGLPVRVVIGSELTRRMGGYVLRSRCLGERKVRMLHEACGAEAGIQSAYGNTQSDLPMLGLARERHLVNPDRKTREAALQRFGAGVRFLTWK